MPPAGPATPQLAATVRLVAAVGALLLTLAILVGGRVPDAVQLMSRFSDKLMHALAYGVLAGFWCIALGGRHRHRVAAVAAAVCTGLLDEWLQRSLPGRQADVADLVADAVGAVVGAWLALPVARQLVRAPVWIRAGTVYFALVFGAGFLLGVLRVPFFEPLIGDRLAQLAEMPLMALVIVLAARWLVRRNAAALSPRACLAAGLLAAAGVLLADALVGIVLRGMTPWQVIAVRDFLAGLAYYTLIAVLALAPWFVRRAGIGSGSGSKSGADSTPG
jgi:VanZ family protein